MRRHEPWWLFCGDPAFAEQCLLQAFVGASTTATQQASLLQVLSRLGSWTLLEQLLGGHPQLLEHEQARAALLHLRQHQNHPNPWLALLPDMEQAPFLQAWRQRWQQASPIAVYVCGGLGDQLEALATLGQPAWHHRLRLIFPATSELALSPLLQQAMVDQPLPTWTFGDPPAEQCWLSWPAMRAVLADAGPEPMPRTHLAHLRRPGSKPWLVVCWRSKVEPGELLWAHLRSLPMAEIQRLYSWLLPWAAQQGLQVIDITRYSQRDEQLLQRLPHSKHLHLEARSLGSLADTAQLVAAAQLAISVDTALIHLAHALDAPRWLLLHRHPDARWRMRLQQDGSSDQRQLKVLQQTSQEIWREPLQRLQDALEA